MCRKWAAAISALKEGSVGPGQAGAEGHPQTLTEEWSLCPQTKKQVVEGLNPSSTGKDTSPTSPIHPPVLVRERPQRNPLACQLHPLWYPRWWTWSLQPWFQPYGSLTIPAQDVVERGQWCRVQALILGIPQSMLSPSPLPDPLAFVQRGSQSPDIGPSSLFLKWVRSASPGLGVQYSPISRGEPEPMVPGI